MLVHFGDDGILWGDHYDDVGVVKRRRMRGYSLRVRTFMWITNFMLQCAQKGNRTWRVKPYRSQEITGQGDVICLCF